ncbi:MAG: SDR family NAD(P)-dependent oxidoreductase [Gammaproteobacteria bacterium]|nr:SDR family NAD(P)-dependent oxidoreductase [Gammaproteobacteria bacterium]
MSAQLPSPYHPPADLLKDRAILVTGAGDGLGRAASLALARHGATVILLGRTTRKLESTYDAIKAEGLPEPAIVPLNLATATWKDYADLGGALEREFGKLHGLLHCAAHFKRFTPLAELDPQEWLEALQVNLTAAFALIRHALPLLRKSGDASVVLVSDRAGRQGKAFHGAYGVSKFALEGLMQTWAQELEHSGVRINSFDPGPLRTALRARGYLGEAAERVPPPDSACPALLYLLGRDSRGLSGRAF